MIFDANRCCEAVQVAELQGEQPLTLDGDGLWVGVLSSGACALEGTNATGRSGDLLLGPGPLTLRPTAPCHLLALRLTGLVVDTFLTALGAARFANSAACPGAAELLARLCGMTEDGERSPTAYALLCALAHADETVQALPPLVAEAVDLIHNHYMTLYGVEDLAEHLGVSKCHLVRVFSSEMGTTPGKYLTHTRVEAAKLLLLDGTYNLDLIASLCGFSGANYLCRVFKRETGSTPAAWRAIAKPTAGSVGNGRRAVETEELFV